MWSRMMMRFWNSASVAVHATLRRMSQNDDATMVFHVYFRKSHPQNFVQGAKELVCRIPLIHYQLMTSIGFVLGFS